MMKLFFYFLLISFLIFEISFADVKLPSIFSNNMVLQQEVRCPIWGFADPGEEITVSLNEERQTTRAGENGRWSLSLEPRKAGGPISMAIKGKNEVVLENILFGEVWFCSGQSNMRVTVQESTEASVNIARADLPEIRFITVPELGAKTPQEDFEGHWEICSKTTVPDFSGVAFYFGRRLHRDLKVPVGLINCSFGGAACEAWMNPDRISHDPEYEQIVKRRHEFFKKNPDFVTGRKGQGRLGLLYNGMLRPVMGFGIRGVIWYQGESNADRAFQYRTLFPELIESWRAEWKQDDLPFYWVQLANFNRTKADPDENDWAELREAQSMARSIKRTGEAVAIDIGDARDIHPRNKADVGNRLAVLALNRVYGKRLLPDQSPRFKSMTIEGNKTTLKFDYVYQGLYSKGARPTGFAIAGEDRKFYWADAEIADKDTIIVWAPEVENPVAVRYGWALNPMTTLYNSADLPMSPFRTDQWPGLTDLKR